MTANCPTCGQAVTVPMLVDLNTNSVSIGEQVVKLAPQEAELAFALARRFPSAVEHGALIEAMRGTYSDSDWDRTNLNVHVSRLRSKLKQTPLRIELFWGRGYAFRIEAQQ